MKLYEALLLEKSKDDMKKTQYVIRCLGYSLY